MKQEKGSKVKIYQITGEEQEFFATLKDAKLARLSVLASETNERETHPIHCITLNGVQDLCRFLNARNTGCVNYSPALENHFESEKVFP